MSIIRRRRARRTHSMARGRSRRLFGGVEPLEAEEERMCWICLMSDEDQVRHDWLHPCRCRGSNKWVHGACLSRWITEKELLAPDVPVTCTQCRTEYIVVMPPLCRFDALLNRLDKEYERLCPSILMGIMSGTVYFSGVSYGALTLLELSGNEIVLQLLQQDPILMMILLPSVPMLLLMGRRIRWDDVLVRWLRRRQRRRVPPEQRNALGEPLPGAPLDDDYFEELEQHQDEIEATEHLGGVTPGFCAALSLPSIAGLLGQTLFGGIYETKKLLAILLGGLTFVVVKGLAGVYLRQAQYQHRRQRCVLNYNHSQSRLALAASQRG
ncbi:hypothetical protein KR032_008546 [Drosophila birchii]|nr:hypothetical protein KR032_008546 [Drosophila birchii]